MSTPGLYVWRYSDWLYTVMWTNIIITAVHTYCNYMYMSISHWVTQHWTMTSVLMIWLYFTECLEYANSHCLFVCLSVWVSSQLTTCIMNMTMNRQHSYQKATSLFFKLQICACLGMTRVDTKCEQWLGWVRKCLGVYGVSVTFMSTGYMYH